MVQFAKQKAVHNDAATLRAFLEQDDGKEFIMLNQVYICDIDIVHPISGEMVPQSTSRQLFAPLPGLYFARRPPGISSTHRWRLIDSWNGDDNLSFSGTAMMRYRSRRDIAELVMDPMFSDGHIYKLAAIERTVSYPTQIIMNGSMAPCHYS